MSRMAQSVLKILHQPSLNEDPLNIVYYHIAARGCIITGNAIIHDTWEINAVKVCPGTHTHT